MTNSTDSAAAAARLRDELSSIAGRMSTVSADFAVLVEQLAGTPAGRVEPSAPVQVPPAPAQTPAPVQAPRAPDPWSDHRPQAPHPTTPPPPPPTPGPYPPQPQLQYVTAPFGPFPGAPTSAPTPPAGPAPQWHSAAPPVPTRSVGERLSDAAERGVIGRVLAAVGVGITLIGVVLLLVLAAQAGLLRPELRVAGGAVFAAALAAVGYRIGRRPQKRSGAVALVATGVAAALFDVLAATSIYHWLPEIAALLIGGAIGATGLALAQRWDSQTLGLMVSVPLLIFAPAAAGGVDPLLVCFMLAYAASTLWMQIGRDWTALYLVNTAATTLPLIVLVFTANDSAAWFPALAALVNAALALGSAVLLAPGSSRAVLVGLVAVVAGVPLPLIGDQGLTDTPTAVAVTALGALLFIAAAVGTRRSTAVPFSCRVAWLSWGAVLAALALGTAMSASSQHLGFLALSVVLVGAARWSDDLEHAVRVVATVFAGLGLTMLAGIGGGSQLLVAGSVDSAGQTTILIGALLGAAVTTVLAYEWGIGVPREAQRIWLVGGLIDLWLVTAVCISIGDLASGGTAAGFRGGHLAATLIWFGAAAAALMAARTARGSARTLPLITGLSVIVIAVAKLFLFDLAALDGVLRVIAFIVAGLVLLSLGVAYAQSLTDDDNTPAEPVH
ncbi:DUF2339 domain-containing protein [Gordonia aichiensis]|uniref:DUF2339 domain-containing protein n=1 Tax=Gordonia aichiensis TaxID=36820 RepID=UPI003264E394